MHVLNKIHIYQEKQCLNTSFQRTNKTSGKHSLVQKPSAQIRGFSNSNKNKLKKKKKNKIRSSKTWSTCTYWQDKPLLCVTRIIFNNMEKWRGQVQSSDSNYKREKAAFHREIDGYSVPIGLWFPISCSCCTQVKWVVGTYFMSCSPTPCLPQSRAAHTLSAVTTVLYEPLQHKCELQVTRSRMLPLIHVPDMTFYDQFMYLCTTQTMCWWCKGCCKPLLLLWKGNKAL